jgi:hypothetical protein
MFGTEHKNTDERLSNRVYVEKALREAATVTGTPSAKPAQTEMLLLEEYVRFLDNTRSIDGSPVTITRAALVSAACLFYSMDLKLNYPGTTQESACFIGF